MGKKYKLTPRAEVLRILKYGTVEERARIYAEHSTANVTGVKFLTPTNLKFLDRGTPPEDLAKLHAYFKITDAISNNRFFVYSMAQNLLLNFTAFRFASIFLNVGDVLSDHALTVMHLRDQLREYHSVVQSSLFGNNTFRLLKKEIKIERDEEHGFIDDEGVKTARAIALEQYLTSNNPKHLNNEFKAVAELTDNFIKLELKTENGKRAIQVNRLHAVEEMKTSATSALTSLSMGKTYKVFYALLFDALGVKEENLCPPDVQDFLRIFDGVQYIRRLKYSRDNYNALIKAGRTSKANEIARYPLFPSYDEAKVIPSLLEELRKTFGLK